MWFLTSLNWTANHTTDTGTDTRGQNDKGERELLGFRFVDIGNETKSNTTTSSRKTTLY
jgi:hypothetical protein